MNNMHELDLTKPRQLTLVAHYGEKPDTLKCLIQEFQAFLSQMLGNVFIPYNVNQVHATIASLQRADTHSLLNLNFAQYRGRKLEPRATPIHAFLFYSKGQGCRRRVASRQVNEVACLIIPQLDIKNVRCHISKPSQILPRINPIPAPTLPHDADAIVTDRVNRL